MARDRDASVRHSGLGLGDASDMEVQGNGMQREKRPSDAFWNDFYDNDATV